MKYTVGLSDLKFYAYHGVYKQESMIGGWFTVDLEFSKVLAQGMRISTLDTAWNYETAYGIVKACMNEPELLLETVAQHIIDKIKLNFDGVIHICIRIQKHQAAGLLPHGSTFVTMEWEQ